MKKILLAIITLTTIATNLSATEVYTTQEIRPCAAIQEIRPCQHVIERCNHGLYIGAFGGANFLHKHKHRIGGNGGLNLGYKFYENLRFEGEIGYKYYSIHFLKRKLPVETYTAMANLYLDFNTGYGVHPYLGAGIGYSYTDVGSTVKREKLLDKLHNVSYQGMAGLAFDVGSQLQLGLEYRCFLIKDEIKDHAALVTLKHFF